VVFAINTVTWRRTNSDANIARRSFWPSAKRYSKATFRPPTWA